MIYSCLVNEAFRDRNGIFAILLNLSEYQAIPTAFNILYNILLRYYEVFLNLCKDGLLTFLENRDNIWREQGIRSRE